MHRNKIYQKHYINTTFYYLQPIHLLLLAVVYVKVGKLNDLIFIPYPDSKNILEHYLSFC